MSVTVLPGSLWKSWKSKIFGSLNIIGKIYKIQRITPGVISKTKDSRFLTCPYSMNGKIATFNSIQIENDSRYILVSVEQWSQCQGLIIRWC